MFCKFCGKNVPSTSKVCPSCGESLREVSRPATQVQMVSVQTEKNLGLGLALAFLFGPLGLLYSSVRWAAILIAVTFVLLMVSCGSIVGGVSESAHSQNSSAGMGAALFGSMLFWLVFLGSWIGSIILSWYSIKEYNSNVRKGIANSDVN